MRNSTTTEDTERLRKLHPAMSQEQLAVAFGRTVSAIRGKCLRLGLNSKWSPLSGRVNERIREWYESHPGKLELDELASELGIGKTTIARTARRMGLTNQWRKSGRKDRRKFKTVEELRAAQSKGAKDRIRRNGHPRGMLGKKHTEEFKAKMGREGTFAKLTTAERRAMAKKGVQTRIEKYGTAAPVGVSNPYSRAKGGKRKDLGDAYFRSRWEANYARYLNKLVELGQIESWEYEKDTFIFEAIKKGTRSYIPDFKIHFHDGTFRYHEVKGWMDKKSQTKLKRMKKYFPDVEVVVIGLAEYKKISSVWAGLIPLWE